MSKFMLFDEHIGQKIYEIEEERHIVIKTRVVAKDDNEAFLKYLECKDTENCENYDVKDYSDHKGTREVGKIVKERCFPNDDEDDSYDIVEEYN